MIRILSLIFLLWCGAANAQLSGGLMFPGPGTAHSAGSAYSGPGDVVSGAFAWWGIRSYTAAGRGTRVANVCNSTGGVDVGCADFNSDATTGIIESKVVSGITCPGANCTVKTLYDQSGNTNCTTACDMTNATVANRPTLNANCIGSLPCMVCSAGSATALNSPNVGSAQAQPFTLSGVANRTGNTTSYADILWMTGSVTQFLFNNAANQFILYGGTLSSPVTAADNSFHAIQGIYNGSSSTIYLDGASTTGLTVGAGNIGAGQVITLCNGNNALSGNVTEAGIWIVTFNGTQLSNMNSNQRSVWGF